jgi:transposase
MPKRSDHNLLQQDYTYLRSLEQAALCDLALRRLVDWKEARERLKQNASNRSRPPSSRAPWERVGGQGGGEIEGQGGDKDEEALPVAGRPELDREIHDSKEGGSPAAATAAGRPRPKRGRREAGKGRRSASGAWWVPAWRPWPRRNRS